MEGSLSQGWTNFHENTGLVYSEKLQPIPHDPLNKLTASQNPTIMFHFFTPAPD
jgi:hypothetical protein